MMSRSSSGGHEIPTLEGMKRIRLVRIHLEEDVGKSIHGENLDDPRASYVDFNCSGVPLMEIVSQPDLSSPDEAKLYLQRLRTIVHTWKWTQYGGGSFRGCDRPLRPIDAREYGTKVEIKNLNSSATSSVPWNMKSSGRRRR